MLSDNIITGKLIGEVSNAIMMPSCSAEMLLENMEPEIRVEIGKICENITNAIIDARGMRTTDLNIDEIVGTIGPKFFTMGVISAMIARDILDENEVPSIEEYCKALAGISIDTKQSINNRLKSAVEKARSKS